MATSQAAHKVKRIIGHDGNAITQQDVSSYQQTWQAGREHESPRLEGQRQGPTRTRPETENPEGRGRSSPRPPARQPAALTCPYSTGPWPSSRTAGIFGYSHLVGGVAEGQAEYVRKPLGDIKLLEIPDDVPDEKAKYLSNVLSTSCNAVKDTAVYHGDEVAIFGAGPIGQMAAVFALRDSAQKIIFVDTEPLLSFVKARFLPEHAAKLVTIDYKQLSHGAAGGETVVSALKDACGGRGPDVAIEGAAGEYPKGWMHWLEMAVGAETDTSEILNEMVEGVRKCGRCGTIGIYVAHTNQVNVGSLRKRRIRLLGNGQAPVHKYWNDLMAMIRSGELDPLQMVSQRVRLDDLDKVYYKYSYDAREEGLQRIFVETRVLLQAAAEFPALTTCE